MKFLHRLCFTTLLAIPCCKAGICRETPVNRECQVHSGSNSFGCSIAVTSDGVPQDCVGAIITAVCNQPEGGTKTPGVLVTFPNISPFVLSDCSIDSLVLEDWSGEFYCSKGGCRQVGTSLCEGNPKQSTFYYHFSEGDFGQCVSHEGSTANTGNLGDSGNSGSAGAALGLEMEWNVWLFVLLGGLVAA